MTVKVSGPVIARFVTVNETVSGWPAGPYIDPKPKSSPLVMVPVVWPCRFRNMNGPSPFSGVPFPIVPLQVISPAAKLKEVDKHVEGLHSPVYESAPVESTVMESPAASATLTAGAVSALAGRAAQTMLAAVRANNRPEKREYEIMEFSSVCG